MSRLASPQAGSRRVAIARPKNDIYVVLLAIALGAVLIGCILLALEVNSYEWKVTPNVQLSPLESPLGPTDFASLSQPVLPSSGSHGTV